MTRKLVDVAQDVICREEDCGTIKGIWMSAIVEGDETILPLRDRIIGRFSAMDIKDPAYEDGRLIVGAGEEFTPAVAEIIEQRGIQKVLIRSTLTCETGHGVCIKCYGRNLASDRVAKIGDALGIIAAQSIGEPGTQLTMRTFHIGGTASSAYKQPIITARKAGTIKLEHVRTVLNQKGETVVVNKNGFAVIYDENEAKRLAANARKAAEEEAKIIGGVFTAAMIIWKMPSMRRKLTVTSWKSVPCLKRRTETRSRPVNSLSTGIPTISRSLLKRKV
jgi:DNA-directed RNA polymerase subunit beta'